LTIVAINSLSTADQEAALERESLRNINGNKARRIACKKSGIDHFTATMESVGYLKIEE
jgi:hypothetical protein